MSGQAPTHRSVASIRSAPIQGQAGPTTPHTPPARTISQTYGSPSTLRADDDIIVIEVGSRHIRLGFAGDSLPKATLQCGPEEQRRVGDFRGWINPERHATQAWAAEHEIWRYDVRQSDPGLVRDKLDRLLRDAFTKYLLIDSKPRRTALVVDSALPLPLLSAVLDTLFGHFQAPLVSLFSTSAACAVVAGLRSAMVVDMGWAETSVTSIYEYREAKNSRTIRAGNFLLDKLYDSLLRGLITGDKEDVGGKRAISFEETEDIMCRLMWCRSSASRASQRQSTQLETVEEQDENEAEVPSPAQNSTTRVPLSSSSPPKAIDVSFEKLADVCDDVFFDPSTPHSNFDDEETPLHLLIYQHLLQLPIDVRAICMSRIIFTGGCSNILGLKERILDEVSSMVEKRGWEPMTGKGVKQLSNNSKLRWTPGREGSPFSSSATSPVNEAAEEVTLTGPAHDARDSDMLEKKIWKNRKSEEPVQGKFRALHSLGPWAGASLLSHLKVPAIATVDRDHWVQQGVYGAVRPGEVDTKTQHRQSMGAGGLIRGGNHTQWTLGAWGVV